MYRPTTYFTFRTPGRFSSLRDLHNQGFVLESECEKIILEQLWVKVAREKEISYADLSRMTGITRQALSKFANNGYRPDIFSALLICRALEIPVEQGFRLTGSDALYSLCRDRGAVLLVNLDTLEVVRRSEKPDSGEYERLFFKNVRKKVNAGDT